MSGPTRCLMLLSLVLGLGFTAGPIRAERPFDEQARLYVEAWKTFYPSRALSLGMQDAIEAFEDRSLEAIGVWVAFNRESLARLEGLPEGTWSPESDGLTLDESIDRRLLAAQIRREIERWEIDRLHRRSPALYADAIVGAIAPMLTSERLSTGTKMRLLYDRLGDARRLAAAGIANLETGRPTETRRAAEQLEDQALYFEAELPEAVEAWLTMEDSGDFDSVRSAAAEAVSALAAHLRESILPTADVPDEPILGRETYARKLELYTDSGLTPEELAKFASDEIEASLEALGELARELWLRSRPEDSLPVETDAIVTWALEAMESNRPLAEQPYLEELRRYRREIESFVRDHGIATVPERSTLSLELAPESSGPMARIGYVSSAPPFDPNPWTTWYLATIPDSYPEQERVDFWRSFNYSFKRFIVIHELFPGHYLQLKLLRENPRPIRILFPYRPFIEGWATFTERVVLDAGYAEGDLLTRLAQLRKRLENANRAYTSVQAHCFGWTEEEVVRHSIEEALLAPQFAKSLWGRLMSSPMQIITYMLVGLELRDLFEAERGRLGDDFETRVFMDTALRTGPVPTAELARVLASHP